MAAGSLDFGSGRAESMAAGEQSPGAPFLPRDIDKPKAPPLKCQGIKTRLTRFIASSLRWDGRGRWIEPFLGSGAVLFNLAPRRALVADSNPHVVQFYRDIQEGRIDGAAVRACLVRMGAELARDGEEFYYEVRERFNRRGGGSLDFLFLNRSCFNGVMRFNARGHYNVPFCRKPHRFSRAYVSRIANQVCWARRVMGGRDWRFEVADWQDTLAAAQEGDFVYLDPPYIGRHTGYYGRWSEQHAQRLAELAPSLSCGFALSMWQENRFRRNDHLYEAWQGLPLRSFEHFYHVGATEALRHRMTEALVIKPGYGAPLSALQSSD